MTAFARTLAAAAVSLALVSGAARAAGPITGHWVTEDGKAVVTIQPCGAQLCGKVSRILDAAPKGALVDRNNPDPQLRKRPIMGLPILTGFARDKDVWRGQIYSPEEGKSYRSIVSRAGPASLRVKGCIAIFCKTQIWKMAR